MFREGVSAGADAWGEASKQAHKLGPGKKPQEHKSALGDWLFPQQGWARGRGPVTIY